MLVVLALSVTLIACGGSDAARTTAPDEAQLGDMAAATTTATASSQGNGDGDSLGIPPVIDRKVIYEGSMTLQAADTRTAFDQILFMVETSGGFLASSTIEEAAEGEQPSIFFTVRVPADKLTATLAEIRNVSDRVVSESLQSQDVTDQFVDIDAQLRNLYALEEELLALLAELRDNPDADPAKLLAVFEQIRYTRGEIEQLEGRKQLLTDLVALATINLTVDPSPAAIPIVPADPVWEPATVAKEALRNLVEAMQALGTVAIRFVLYTLPVLLLVIGPFAILGWWLWRRARRAKPVPVTVGATES
ncbi:MAG: DUF4349 domain-containing protein [Acidimicrobiia bacterium]|nr:DUF4349 domain-containing protein [Acidimicrobiia bacterium]